MARRNHKRTPVRGEFVRSTTIVQMIVIETTEQLVTHLVLSTER